MSGIEVSRRLVVVNAASTVLRKILLLTVLVWLQQHLIRRIEPEEYSLYPVLMALMLTFPLVTSLFTSGLRRYMTEAYAREDLRAVTRFVSSMLPFLAALVLAILVGGGLFAWHIASILEIAPELETDARIMFGLLVVGSGLRLLLAPFGMGFYLRQKFVLGNVIGLTVEVLRIVVLLALLSISPRVLWVVVAMFVAGVYDVLIATVISRRLVPALRFERGLMDLAAVRPLFGFGGWAVLNQIGLLIRNAADPIILNKLAGPIDVQAFYLGALPDTQVRRFTLETGGTAQPAVTAMHATGQEERLGRTFLRLSRYSLWAMALVAVPCVVYRHEFFQLYLREEYAENAAAATVMLLLMARYVVIFPNTLIGMIAVARAKVRAIAIRAAAMSAVNLALTLYLVGALEMGAVGSALATFAVTIIGAPLLFWPLGLQLSGASFREWMRGSILPGLLPAVVAAPAWLALRALVPPEGWVSLGLDAAAGALVYGVVLLRFALTPRDREELRSALARVRALLAGGERAG
jgi:membrane protein EpsK